MTKALYSVADARRRARRALPPVLWDFVEGGGGLERTLGENEESFQRLTFAPRVGTGVVAPDTRTRILGADLDAPIIFAPCGGLALVHPHGQLGAARAAASSGTVAAVSVMCGADLTSIVEDREAAAHWFQLYKLGGRPGSEALIEVAKASGYGALVVSVDTPVGARRDRDMKHTGVRPGGFMLDRVTPKAVLQFAPRVATRPRWALRFMLAGFPVGHPVLRLLPEVDGKPMTFEHAVRLWRAEPVTWADVRWMREQWPGPLVVKGVLTADDALRAVDAGADAVVVSNHGGRQLDGTPASIDALPAVAAAVPGNVDVLLDGGVRLGIDVIRALALGARAVLIGRPYIYGLAVAGEPGARQIIELLSYQLREAMQLLGAASIADLDRSFLY